MQNVEAILNNLIKAVEAKQPLHPIFDSVFAYKARPLRISRNPVYQSAILTNNGIVNAQKDVLIEKVKQESEQISQLASNSKVSTSYYLLQKHGWRIGTPGDGDLQDVAYCDAQRIRFALENNGDSNYLLIKGDLAGIQGYIYGGLKPKVTGAMGDLSKRLRGRSTIVSLLTEFLAKVILQELELPIWHLLFAGGGHFNLLLPKSKEGDLAVLSEKLDKEMRRWFGDRLNLILAWVDADNSIESGANEYFQQVNEAVKRKKHRQHHKSLEDHFFPPFENKVYEIDEIKIGEQFPKQCLIGLVASKSGIATKNYASSVVDFELYKHHYQLLLINGKEKKKAIVNAEGLLADKSSYNNAELLFINDTDFLPETVDWDYQANTNVCFGFVFMGRHLPLKKDDGKDIPKDFEDLCFQQDEAETLTPEQMRRGFLRLGAMRLDVDDLGFIFSNGLGQYASLGQIACLSREMHYFFTAHFDFQASKHEIYVIYSGGDDAFVVGKWDNIIRFALQIEDDFNEFTQNPSEIHFSAGIFMGDPKYPVGRFYRDAGQLQDDAKSNYLKNKVDVFDQVINWKEFSSKIDLGKAFADILTKGTTPSSKKLTRSFANRVLRLVKSSFHERSGYDEEGQPVRRGFMDVQQFSRNLASMRYLFARNGYSRDEFAEVKDEMEKQLTTDFINSFDYDAIGKPDKQKQIRNYLVAFNYALYTIRSQEKSLKL